MKEEIEPKTMIDNLELYFKNTPREKVLEDWELSKVYDNIGPTVDEFLSFCKKKKLYKATDLKPRKPFRLRTFRDRGKAKRKRFITLKLRKCFH